MIDWPTDLVESAARRRAIFFLGSGISRTAQNASGQRPPLWREFLEGQLQHCGTSAREIKSFIKVNDYLTACELLRKRLDDQWEKALESAFLTPKFKPAAIHKAIFKIDLSTIITSNVDQIYDHYAQQETQNYVRIKTYYDEDIGRAVRASAEQRLILKVHGCVSTPHRAVFTRSQYANSLDKYANFYRILESLLSLNTVAFVGCSLADPDINLLLEKNSRAFQGTPSNYLITSNRMSEDMQKMYKENYNLKIVNYRSNDNHKELTDSLFKLSELVDENREKISMSRLW